MTQVVDIRNGNEVVQFLQGAKAMASHAEPCDSSPSLSQFCQVLTRISHPARGPEDLVQGGSGHVRESLLWDRVPVQVRAGLTQVQQLGLGQGVGFSPNS